MNGISMKILAQIKTESNQIFLGKTVQIVNILKSIAARRHLPTFPQPNPQFEHERIDFRSAFCITFGLYASLHIRGSGADGHTTCVIVVHKHVSVRKVVCCFLCVIYFL